MAENSWQTYFHAVKKQDWQSAKELLLQLAKTEKNNPQIYLKIGDICQRTGETAEAISAYAQASQILRLQGFVQKALATYKIALRLDPDNQDLISRAEILLDELETVRAKPPIPSPARSADHGQPPLEEKEPPMHSPAPAATSAPAWLETTSVVPEKSDAKFPAAGTPPWLETTSLETEKPAGKIPAAGIPSWLEMTSLSPEEPAGSVSRKPAEDSSNRQPEPSSPSPAPPRDDDEAWIEAAFEALDTRMFSSDVQQTTGTAADDNAPMPQKGPNHVENPELAQQRHEPQDMPAEMKEIMPPLSEGRDTKIPEAFSALPDDMLHRFMHDLSRRAYTDTQTVIEEGDSGDSLYIIRSGKAKVVAHLLGKSVELAVLGSGDVFGEVGFLTGRPRTASVIADGPLEVYEITRREIEKLIESTPAVMAKIEDFYEMRVRDTLRQIKS